MPRYVFTLYIRVTEKRGLTVTAHVNKPSWVPVFTLSSSWYLVMRWTGLMSAEEMELARPCLLCTS